MTKVVRENVDTASERPRLWFEREGNLNGVSVCMVCMYTQMYTEGYMHSAQYSVGHTGLCTSMLYIHILAQISQPYMIHVLGDIIPAQKE